MEAADVRKLEAAEQIAVDVTAKSNADDASNASDDDEDLGEYWDPVVRIPDDWMGKLWFFTMWPWYWFQVRSRTADSIVSVARRVSGLVLSCLFCGLGCSAG